MANTGIFKKYLFTVLIPVVAKKVDGCPNKGLETNNDFFSGKW